MNLTEVFFKKIVSYIEGIVFSFESWEREREGLVDKDNQRNYHLTAYMITLPLKLE